MLIYSLSPGAEPPGVYNCFSGPDPTGVYTCLYCGHTIFNRRQLQQHVDLHLGHRPHLCPVCGLSFRRKSNMRRHLATHIPEEERQMFVCEFPGCDHRSTRHDNLRAHQMSAHGLAFGATQTGLPTSRGGPPIGTDSQWPDAPGL